MKCRYCGKEYVKDGREHVFPKGMGGEDIFMDNVCNECNSKFSEFERELMRDSPIGLMRSVEGIEVYRKSGKPAGVFEAPIMFSFDEKTKCVYEIGQRYPLQNFVRPQILLIDGKFFSESENADTFQKLVKHFNHWKKEIRFAVVKIISNNASELQWIEFVDTENQFENITRENSSPVKDSIKIDILRSDYELFAHLSPRLFLNDREELKIRARSIEEAVKFLSALMNHTREQVFIERYNKDGFKHPIIYVGQSFDSREFSQGLVKIAINCLMYYYPAIKNSQSLDQAIEYVMTGKGDMVFSHEGKDNIKDSTPDSHNLFFQQSPRGMYVRVSFCNGAGGAFSFYVMGLMVLTPGDYSRLIVKYKDRVMEFQDRTKVLTSFYPARP